MSAKPAPLAERNSTSETVDTGVIRVRLEPLLSSESDIMPVAESRAFGPRYFRPDVSVLSQPLPDPSQIQARGEHVRTQKYVNILSSYDSNSLKKRHPNQGRLYNVSMENKTFNTPVVNQSSWSAGGGFVYTSGEENPAITIYEPENIR